MNASDNENFAPLFDENGLLPTVVCHYETSEVLMVAYMDKEALERTMSEGVVYFFSRSRRTLWKKGETSGNLLCVREIFTDCDQDCLLVKVSVQGDGKACHTGRKSCFYRVVCDRVLVEKKP